MTTLTRPSLLSEPAGPLPTLGTSLISLVRDAGLTGRGGAGFPTWRKLAAVASGDRAVVIGNGAEGEPASAKDKTLLTRSPHLVLDGLRLAADAVNATDCYLYLPAALVGHVSSAMAARPDRFAVRLVAAPDTFVSGEESAVIARIGGGKPLPTDKRGLVVESGLRGRPTLVRNVETLAHIASIARNGPAWFRWHGTDAEPGTFLATVGGAVNAPGVYEVPYGIPLTGLLDLAGGPAARLSSVLVGGYHGTWLPRTDVPMSRAGLAPFGATPGAGVVHALPASYCGLVETARITRYLADQSARQCGPCRFGLPAMADTLRRLAAGERDRDLPGQVAALTALVVNRGACHHPDGTVRLVRSALTVFADEIDLHLAGRCSTREG
ncbi:MAG TPA: NADH-ubiquinone oxidoreductase-F iron-sulfur binding region domain-containing protein [Pseudonocardiaceae bacterium]